MKANNAGKGSSMNRPQPAVKPTIEPPKEPPRPRQKCLNPNCLHNTAHRFYARHPEGCTCCRACDEAYEASRAQPKQQGEVHHAGGRKVLPA